MKKIQYIISAAVFVCFALVTSCNDDFLEKTPKSSITDDNFFASENDLKLYLNYFYPWYITGHENGFGGPGNSGGGGSFFPRGTISFRLHRGDLWTDNMIQGSGTINSRYNGVYRVPTGTGDTGWEFTRIYHVNYFLQRYHQAPLPKNVLDRYKAEALFFKAWEYYQKVSFFGDYPWLSKDLQTDSPELYMARTPRAAVMDSVLHCINFAIEHLPAVTAATPTGRINKDHALALKSRICLFEGTFRKYHGLPGADKFLQECVNASDELIKSGRYALYTSTDGTPYWNLFKFKGTSVSHKEAILARIYNPTAGVQSYGQRYIDNNGTHRVSATRGLVDEYLCIDGKPITSSPLFLGYGAWTELDNRDPRLRQTICKPGEFMTVYNRNTGVMDINRTGVTYPVIAYNGAEASGYKIMKHWMADPTVLDGNSNQIGIEFRYAEILLNYVEALAVLNESNVTDAVLDLTINALRRRVGWDFTQYPDAQLKIGNIPDDPRLDAIYNDKLDYTVSPLMREIRRERRVEFAIEDRRYEDLMRWKAGPLLEVPLRGMKFTAVEEMYKTASTIPATPTADSKSIVVALKGRDVYVDDDGFIILYPLDDRLGNRTGTMNWDNFRYFWPVPQGQILLNNNLVQSPGWENYY